MKHLFDKETAADITRRINRLSAASKSQWGKMNVSQMMAHCSAALEVASGEKTIPRMFIGRILGPIFKSKFTNEKELDKNSPTAKEFIFRGPMDFEKEKIKLIDLLYKFSSGGKGKCTKHPHSFFGILAPEEWSVGMYKHMDHHLRQFGV